MQSLFITGTDTDVGKTWVSAALLRVYKSLGVTSCAVKPVAAGGRIYSGEHEIGKNILCNDDALLLQACMTANMTYQQVNPIIFEQAIAPHIAASEAKTAIDIEYIVKHVQTLQTREEDLLLIEGAGGWLVPLNQESTFADLVVALDVPVIMVVDMRLGCLNHALLTETAIQSSGVQLLGWVANTSTAKQMRAYQENLQTLKQKINAPCIAEIPYVPEINLASDRLDVACLARYFDRQQLQSLLAAR